MGARVTSVIEYNNLTLKKIKGCLNGHVIFDTGDIPKLDKIDFTIEDIPKVEVKLQKGDKIMFKYKSAFLNGVLVGISNKHTYYVDCGLIAYEVSMKQMTCINGISLETGKVILLNDIKNGMVT